MRPSPDPDLWGAYGYGELSGPGPAESGGTFALLLLIADSRTSLESLPSEQSSSGKCNSALLANPRQLLAAQQVDDARATDARSHGDQAGLRVAYCAQERCLLAERVGVPLLKHGVGNGW